MLVGALALMVMLGASSVQALGPHRLVFVRSGLATESECDRVVGLIARAAASGYTGVVLSSAFDRIALRSPAYFDRLDRVHAACVDAKLALIPALFSAGWGGGVLAHDCNLAAAVPLRDVAFVVRDGIAVHEPSAVAVTNGGFEVHDGDRAAGYDAQDRPGRVSYIDYDVQKNGRTSLRFQNFARSLEYHGRVMQRIETIPFHGYRVGVWVRTAGFDAADGFRIDVRGSDGRVLTFDRAALPATSDWQRIEVSFNALSYSRVRLAIGVWEGRAGRLWIDDMTVEETGLDRVLNRPGAPLTVQDDVSGRPLVLGADYRVDWGTCAVGSGPTIVVMDNARTRAVRLRVSAYQAVAIGDQRGVCMGEDKVYDIWRQALDIVNERLAPETYLLNMDEVRQGGWCRACSALGETAGDIFVACVNRQIDMIRAVNRDARVMMWSDMIDPFHNAVMPYYLTRGGFVNAWKGLPQDLMVVCWRYESREASLAHFASSGFNTIVAAYYDTASLDNPRGWVSAVSDLTTNRGVMYTTWRDDYNWLEAFGVMASGR